MGETKPPAMELKGKELYVTELSLEEIKKHPTVHVSPRAAKVNKASTPSGRSNCLCSPTTHAGSFRCRHHRVSGMSRGGSIGSNLSNLALIRHHHKSPEPITDNLQSQTSF
ncbi:Farnesyl diphosphate synthase 2 [Hibiscus syriacus]|uniref:Farnesyl diphosphate synthase 2 n=1 Tax=Hibiscus syriacus TaxID=106335 RepID=A0A6A2W940_HIBSY|nr:Farnesyl diphosphate synthase 2 [Hibiscus syriacus]